MNSSFHNLRYEKRCLRNQGQSFPHDGHRGAESMLVIPESFSNVLRTTIFSNILPLTRKNYYTFYHCRFVNVHSFRSIPIEQRGEQCKR